MAKHPHNSKRPARPSVLAAIEAQDLDALLAVMPVRQRRFCEEYLFDYNGAAAAVRAGYSKRGASQQAAHQLKNPGVMYYIDHLTKQKETNITIVDEDYIIQKIVKTIDKAEDIVNLTAVLRGLELLGRHKGMLTDKQEITGKDGGSIKIEEINQEARSFTELLKTLADRASKNEK